MDFVTAFNALEAVWWAGLGLALFVVPVRADVPGFRRSLAGVLIVFGISDAIELWSGAWWRPWWLAVLKVSCGVAIGVLALLWFRQIKKRRP